MVSSNAFYPFVFLIFLFIKLIIRLIYISTNEVDSKLFLAVCLGKVDVSRDDFLLNMSFTLKNRTCSGDANKSSEFTVGRSKGWDKFIALDELFDRSLKFLDENSTMILDIEVSSKKYKFIIRFLNDFYILD
jgi:hypothetical protein